MTITISELYYWNEIEIIDWIPVVVKDILKELINSYLHNTIHAQINQFEKEALKHTCINEIEIKGRLGYSTILTIMHFIPDNSETHREFLYLAKCYPNGTSNPFTK